MAGGLNIICDRYPYPMHPDAPACTDYTGSAAVGRRVWANKILNLSSVQRDI